MNRFLKWICGIFQIPDGCLKLKISRAWLYNACSDSDMGAKTSSLIWCDRPFSEKESKYIYCYKLPPPSFNYNWTDIHYAASHGNVRRIQEVIQKSGTTNLNRQDYYGKTPLYWAAYKGHKNCIEELLLCGASVNIHCRHGGTPLHAVVSLYPECALLLIKHGADVNQSDNWGVTPMYLAATSGQLDVIRYLIAAGANLSFRNKKTGEIPKKLFVHRDFCNSLISMSQNPFPLQQLCRTKIRSQLGEGVISKVTKMDIPNKLKDYIILEELK